MESSDASWHSFDPSVAMEDSEAMAQLLGVQYFGNEHKQPTPAAMYWPGQDADQYSSSAPYYMQHLNSGESYDDHGYYGAGTFTMTGDFFVPEEQTADPSFMLDLNLDFEDQDAGGSGGKPPACKRKLELDQKDGSTTGTVPVKKKGRSTAMPAPKKGKTAQSKKAAQKGACSIQANQEESNGNLQSSSNYLSDDDSQEMTACSNVSSASKKSSSSSGRAKARAERGAATDPQSLYARKRRERINERLKILQNLVPNGTKVDISTMLEEAVQYVKFLRLQIKLLSSDDLWMFAPIAYNGVNVGLDLKISPPQQ